MQPARTPCAQRRDGGLGIGEAVQDVIGDVGEQSGGVGRADAPAGLLQQHRAGLALERRDLLADRARGVSELFGGDPHRPGAHDGAQDPQSP